MASEHERLVEDVAKTIADWPENYRDYLPRARAGIALIAERTKEANEEMWKPGSKCYGPASAWRVMHAASALWPSHGTDGIGER